MNIKQAIRKAVRNEISRIIFEDPRYLLGVNNQEEETPYHLVVE